MSIRLTRIIPNAEAIVRARVLQGKSQTDVAATGNIPRASVSRVERGYDASAATAAGICAALGKEFDELFTIKRPGGGVSSTAEKGA